jgi:hypothetical protein
MGKILGFLILLFPLAIIAQMGGGFGDDFEKPEGGKPQGKPPMGGRGFNSSMMPDSAGMQEQKSFEDIFECLNIINRNAEAFISTFPPAIDLPQLSLRWEQIKDSLRRRQTQGEKNESLKFNRQYLSFWDTLTAAIDSTSQDSFWLMKKLKNNNAISLDSLKGSLSLVRDSMTIALEMNKKISREISARLHEMKEMFSQISSKSEQSEQEPASKSMLFTLKVNIVNMENDIEILNRESHLGEKILIALNKLL